MTTNQFPQLRQLFGCYLHQDWPLEYDTAEDAIRAFRADMSSAPLDAECEELSEVIELLNRQAIDDPTRFLIELGCDYNTAADGLTVVAWLVRVRSILKGDE